MKTSDLNDFQLYILLTNIEELLEYRTVVFGYECKTFEMSLHPGEIHEGIRIVIEEVE